MNEFGNSIDNSYRYLNGCLEVKEDYVITDKANFNRKDFAMKFLQILMIEVLNLNDQEENVRKYPTE